MGIKVSGLQWCADRIPVNRIFWHLNGCSFLQIYTCFGGNNPDPPFSLCLSRVEGRSISAVAWNKKLLHEELQKSCWNEDPSKATFVVVSSLFWNCGKWGCWKSSGPSIDPCLPSSGASRRRVKLMKVGNASLGVGRFSRVVTSSSWQVCSFRSKQDINSDTSHVT